ncbi:MAG: hypothetical protein KatS3mg005_4043 [Bryobacteraceae bacterium]|nr:MAG: hypothetical protein KatS3mg005_4043 [Bryobacteraceae bacterium]
MNTLVRKRAVPAVLWILALAGFSGLLPGQSTFATLTGIVTDPSGAPVAGAQITVVNVDRGYEAKTTTNELGQYTIPSLLEGVYQLKVAAQGFQEAVADNIRLAPRDIRRVDVGLTLSQVATTVEVSAGATLVETETARVADTRTRQTIIDMPLSLRRAWDLIQLSPNVSKTAAGFNMRFGGSRTRQGDVTVDGIPIGNVFGGQITGVVSDRTESYGEVRLEVAGSSAENPGIGQMSVVTRSGTNELHGEVFNYYSSPGLQARNPFSVVNTGSIEHMPGGSLGGPVILPKIYNGRNRTFFFTSLEFERFGPPSLQTFNTTVPLEPWRTGNFSSLLPGTVVRDPFANNAPFANNVIPTSRISSVARTIQDRLYPLPNYGDPTVFAAQNNRQVLDNPKLTNPTAVARLDHRFSERAFVNGRITILRWPQKPFIGSLPTIGRVDRERRNNGASFAYTQMIRPNLLSEFRYGMATDAFPSFPPQRGLQWVRDLGLQGLAPNLPDVAGLPTVNFTQLGLTGVSMDVECNPCIEYVTHNFQQNVTWITGRHTIKFGAQINRGTYEDLRQGAGLFGNLTFSNRFTNFTYADFLLGIPTTMSRNFPALLQSTTAWRYGFFIQDDYRIRPDLTLNIGLRYDLLPGFTAKDGLQSTFDIGTGAIIIPDGASGRVSPLMPAGYVPVLEASRAGFHSSRLLHADRNNFSPRIGLAYRPWGNNTVFRASFGMFYDIAAKNAALSSVPFNIAEPAFTNPTTNPILLPQAFPTAGVAGPASVSIPTAMNPNLLIPYSMQYTFTIERQQWETAFRATYLGTNTRKGVFGYNINQPVADTRLFVDKPRMFPQYPAITYQTNGAGHQYHALTLEVDRPLKGGLRAQGYYTLARDIGDLEDGEQPEDAFNRQRERSVWVDIPTHRFSANMLYQLPMGKGQPLWNNAGKVVNTLISGWQVGAAYMVQRGQFLTPTWTGPDPTGTRFTPNRTPPNVTIRPDILRNPNISNPTVNRWYDINAFAAPQPGAFGTSAKGVIVGPGVNVLHANLAKITQLGEKVRLRLEMIATNALNHPNYQNPGLNVNNLAAAGVITNVANRNTNLDSSIPRFVQLVVRLQW